MPRDIDVSLDEIKRMLVERVEEYAEYLKGEPPNKRLSNKTESRWGKKGAWSVVVSGSKRGEFWDFAAEVGGSLLDATVSARACTFSEAIRIARAFLGLADDWTAPAPSDATLRDREQRRAQLEAQEAHDLTRRIAWARNLAGEAEPLSETLAERYLVDTRDIPRPAGGWPDCVRFHRGETALLVVSTTPAGDVQAVQLVYLGADARKLPEAGLAARKLPLTGKQTFGTVAGSAVRLPGDANGPLLVGEGPETGLSGWSATGNETWISLSRLLPPDELPADRRILWLADDDPQNSPRDKALRRAIGAWRSAGLDVTVVTPWPARHFDRSDFNDLIRENGPGAVRARIISALSPNPKPSCNRLPVKKAREELDSEIGWFFSDVPLFDAEADASAGRLPRVDAIKADLGTGKSRSARHHAARTLVHLRDLGDKRNIAFAVPTHKLADEQAIAFEMLSEARKANLRAMVWRGREAADPDAAGKAMCLHLDAVRDALDAGLPIQTSVCRKKAADGTVIECPFFRSCGYQKQANQKADLWIVAHEMPFSKKPTTLGKLAALVVDESCWQDGLRGVDGKRIALSLDSLDLGAVSESWLEGRQSFVSLRMGVLSALRDHPDGPITREAMAKVMTAREAKETRALEFQRMIDPEMHPMMTSEERRQAKRMAAGNRTILRLVDFWRAMEALLSEGGPEASGWAAVATVEGDDGPVRVIQLKGRKPIRDGWQVPTLHLDATMNIDLLRPYWPQIKLRAEIAVESPYMKVRQVTDRAYSKQMLEQIADAPDAKRREKNLRKLHAILCREARHYAPEGRTLVVAQLNVEESLPSVGPLPPSADIAHHNAVAGRDEWRDVRNLIVVGRTLPGPLAVERIAEALTGRAIPSLGRGRWFDRSDALREIVSGEWPNQETRFVPAEADRHPDAIAEAIRWQIAEGELLQIVGRGRGVNRTADDPLDVLLLTNVPLPLPIAEALSAEDLEPGLADLMLAAGGVAYENPTDCCSAYPILWPTRSAAERALQRERSQTSPYRYTSYRGMFETSGLARLEYQLAGSGKRPCAAWYDPVMEADAEAALTRHLGSVAWCRISGPEPPTPPSPDPPRPPAGAPVPSIVLPGPPLSLTARLCPAPEPELDWSDDPFAMCEGGDDLPDWLDDLASDDSADLSEWWIVQHGDGPRAIGPP